MRRASARVALCQPRIILGGRLRVILAIVDTLNQIGVVPDILTGKLFFSPSSIIDYYGKTVQANFRYLPLLRVPGIDIDLETAVFNFALRFHVTRYDLLINTSNSLHFLPESLPLMSYVFFPRKRRIMSEVDDLHLPEVTQRGTGLQRRFLRSPYRSRRIESNHSVISMTHFTLSALRLDYDLPDYVPVIYPPVEIDEFWHAAHDKERAVVSVGRFAPTKRQLDQIRLAAQLPDIPFHIIGFAGGNAYYEECANYIKRNGIQNVTLYPDADFIEVVKLLRRCKFFLHTLVNEPFGLTAVQSIAAGCLPIVHDSGGQRETVPYQQLRYQSLSDVPSVINFLSSLTPLESQHLMTGLQEHVRRNFSANVFHTRMKDTLQNLLGSP